MRACFIYVLLLLICYIPELLALVRLCIQDQGLARLTLAGPPLHFGDPLVSCSVLEHLSQCLSLHQCQVDFFGRIVDASEFIMPTGSLLGTVKPHFGVNDVDILPCRSEHFTQKETPVVSKPLLVFVGM